MSKDSIALKSASTRDSDPKSQTDNPFSTIESAQDFVKLLTKAAHDATQELQLQLDEESGSEVSRRLDALRIALYSLVKLESHLHQTSRILNDLRTLRRLMLAEREIKSNPSPMFQSRADEDGSAEETETLPSFDQFSS